MIRELDKRGQGRKEVISCKDTQITQSTSDRWNMGCKKSSCFKTGRIMTEDKTEDGRGRGKGRGRG